MRSMRAECMGSAYMSGSRCFDQRKFVKMRAMYKDMRTWKSTFVSCYFTPVYGRKTYSEEKEYERKDDEEDGQVEPAESPYNSEK